MYNPVELLISSIYKLLVDCADGQGDANLPKHATSAIRLHTDKLKQSGDLSVSSEDGWRKLLSIDYFEITFSTLANDLFENCHKVEELKATCRSLVEASSKSLFPLADFQLSNGHFIAHLQRQKVINEIMQLVICNEANYGVLQKKSNQQVQLMPLQKEDGDAKLSFHRVFLVHRVLENLLQNSSWNLEVTDKHEDKKIPKVKVTSVAAQQIPIANCTFIKCGVVTEPVTKKVATLNIEEYNALRANDIYLMARHKYGIRAKLDERFKALISKLGKAAATVDLLEVKHTSPVHIIRNGTGSTKGAAFILYNSARLETLLRTFDQHVENKSYPPLPALQEIDLSLLKEEEEWQLIYVYIFAFPQLIETCLDRLQQGLVATHLISRFLNKFISLFSVYYRRVRILTEGRSHLLPVLFARIYLLKAIRIVLNKTLALFDISPITFM